MSKFKKLIISLSLVLTMMVAMAVGIGIFAPKTKADSSAPEVERDYFAKYRQEDVTYSFEEPVEVKEGTPTIDYSYAPSDDTKAGGAVAYEYVFNNPNTHTIGVDLHKIEAEGVNISYAYLHDMDETLDITSGTSPYQMPNIEAGKSCRIFVIVSPEESDIPAEFTSDIRWNYGKPGKTKFVAGGSELEVDIIKGAPIDMSIIPEAPGDGYYFDTWASDPNFEHTLDDNYTNQGGTLYARYANLPADWLLWNSSQKCYYVRKGSTKLVDKNISDLVIPATWDDNKNGRHEVQYINSASSSSSGVFYNNTCLQSVDFPSSIKTIGNYAFYDCTYIEELNFKQGLETLGTWVFYRCRGLTDVVLPDGLVTIGNNAFDICSGLTSIHIPNTVRTMGDYAIASCGALKSITIPEGVTKLGKYVLGYCGGLESVTIPSTVTELPQYAFYNGYKLVEVNLPDTLTTIVNRAFYNCPILPELNIPDSVTSIGEYAFYNCKKLEEIKLPVNLKKIENYTFYSCSGLVKVDMPAGLESIGDYAFKGCENLVTGEIPQNLTRVGNYAFAGCAKLGGNLDFSEGLISIGESAFESCAFTSLSIPASINSIGAGAFYKCSKFNTIVVDSGNAVYDSRNGCNALMETATDTLIQGCKNTEIPSETLIIGNYAFYNTGIQDELILPTGLTSIGDYSFYGCSGLTGYFNIPSSVEYLGGCAFYGCSSLKGEVVIPSGITTIRGSAFYGCYGLSKLKLHDNIIDIMGQAFYECSALVGNLELPSNLTNIGNRAFYNCNKITGDIIIPRNVTNVGDYAFYNCTSISGRLEIPSGVTAIGTNAFYACQFFEGISVAEENAVFDSRNDCNAIIKTATNQIILGCGSTIIPTDVVSIASNAFYGCDRLVSITIPQGMTSIGSNAFQNCTRLIVVNNLSTSLSLSKGSTGNGYVAYYAKYLNEVDDSSILIADGVKYFVQGDECIALCAVDNRQDIVLIDGTTSINDKAFYKSIYISTIATPNSLTRIGTSAFEGCYNLNSFVISSESNLNTISSKAFYECRSLTSITLPSKMQTIESSAFSSCYSLLEVYNLSGLSLTKANSSNGSVAYYAKDVNTDKNTISKLYKLNGIVYYKESATSTIAVTLYDTNVSNIVLDESTTKINDYAFYDRDKIASVSFSSKLTHIGRNAFYDCDAITSIVIPRTVTSIGESAFYTASALKYVEVYASGIAGYAFKGCASIENLILGEGVRGLSFWVFSGCSKITSIYIPSTLTNIDSTAFDSSYLTEIVISDSNTVYDSRDNCNAIINTKNNELMLGCVNTVIPNTVTSLSGGAFDDCYDLTHLFIPASVTSIPSNCFDKCRKLVSIVVDGNNSVYDSRDNCNAIIKTSTNTLVKGCRNTIIPQGIKIIGASAFVYCSSLTNIVIPSSVVEIKSNAFYQAGLTSAVFENPNGWMSKATILSSNDLKDVAIAAKYLTSTYRYDGFTRSE